MIFVEWRFQNRYFLFLLILPFMFQPGGSLFLTTINKTYASYLLAVVAAENILNLVARGTHEWDKFISPSDLQYQLSQSKRIPLMRVIFCIYVVFYSRLKNIFTSTMWEKRGQSTGKTTTISKHWSLAVILYFTLPCVGGAWWGTNWMNLVKWRQGSRNRSNGTDHFRVFTQLPASLVIMWFLTKFGWWWKIFLMQRSS